MARAWILNFTAEEELEAGAERFPSRKSLARMEGLREKLGSLLPEGDCVLGPNAPSPGPQFEGRAWCPTRSAVKRWIGAGVSVPPHPDMAVLRTVNHRAFSASLGQCMQNAHFIQDVHAAMPLLETNPHASNTWCLKRAFGYRGTGRLLVQAGHATKDTVAWVTRSEGLQIEPWVKRLADFALHGFVGRQGELFAGAPTVQEIDGGGSWITSRRDEGQLRGDERDALYGELENVARALHRASYFGPFGIDAFRWEDAAGMRHFCARCEINARYSMGWAIGMGPLRPDLERMES